MEVFNQEVVNLQVVVREGGATEAETPYFG